MAVELRCGENGYMSSTPLNRLAAIRKAKGLSQQQLADAVDAHWITISKLERGKIQMTFSWMERLSEALGVFPAELLSDGYLSGEIRVSAQILNSEVKVNKQPLPTQKTYAYDLDQDEIFWVKVSDSSLRPFFRNGDLIKFARMDRHNVTDHVGRIALCWSDTFVKNNIGIIELSSSSNLIELRRFNAPPMLDFDPEIVWIAAEIRYYLVSALEGP